MVPPPPPPPLREPARRRRWPRWVALAAGVVLVVVGALALVSTATRSSTPRGTTVPLDGVERLAVTTRAGNVTILSEERGDIGVEAELTSTWIADADLDVTDQGGTLRVDGRCGGLVVGSGCRVDVVVRVPDGVIDDAMVTTTAGDVDIHGVAAAVSVRTTAGDITLTNLRGSVADLRTTAGNVDVVASTPPARLAVQTTAGDVELRLPTGPYRVEAETTAGDVDVRVEVDDAAELVVTATTTAGDITVAPR